MLFKRRNEVDSAIKGSLRAERKNALRLPYFYNKIENFIPLCYNCIQIERCPNS